ncbi:heavy metal translocating P-type ATPase [Alteromonas confluentis]|uniref:ATPase P n=1 Tax=Alteromonas confluentis TaxID=1656094 RepID=A0A1E7ZF92_9ALTE|nr:heavy metal translocating P-type ATPase [Alteromonas confluentis]OFC72183.1 ATPase P [Alteromonas confluentis]
MSTESCYHCGEPNDHRQLFSAIVLGESRQFCCPGCLAVAEAIVDNGLEDYYQFRTEPAAKGATTPESSLDKLALYDEPALQEEFVYDEGKHKQIEFTLEGITCAACGWLIEKQLSKVSGIKKIAVNVAQRRAVVTWEPDTLSLSQIMASLQRIGYPALPFQPDQHEATYKAEDKQFLKKLGLAGLMTMQVMMLAAALYFDLLDAMDAQTVSYFHWIALVLTTPVVFYSGSTFYLGALKALAARSVNMDVPVTIAVFATYFSGTWATISNGGDVFFESICMFIFLLLLSRFLEHRSRHRAAQISANMLQYIPVTANKLNADGTLVQSLAKALKINDTVVVKAGETVPVDGIIVDGSSEFDESMLTGEFNPSRKTVGDTIFGGTNNLSNSVTIHVTQTLKHALVNQIIRLQSVAMASKPKVAQLADRFSSLFVSLVLFIAALTFVYWYWQDDPRAFWITISVLVATCPCALGLATPTALTCAMATLNKKGILLKRADALEQLASITTIVMDKTGTLTEGRFAITESWFADNEQKDTIMHVMASLESRSEHPIAAAFSADDLAPVTNVTITAGKGIEGDIHGQCYKAGSARFTACDKLEIPIIANVYLVSNDKCLAAFRVTDQIKSDAEDVLSAFSNFKKVLLSGDIQQNVDDIAAQLHIDEAIGGNSPEDKLNVVHARQAANEHILMMGDGINDAPVLAAADVSVAVGNATDIARSAADVIFLNEKLTLMRHLLSMASRVKRVIRQNMAWAIGYNLMVLPFAVSGILTPWMAVIGMSLSSIIVVTNSTKLLK